MLCCMFLGQQGHVGENILSNLRHSIGQMCQYMNGPFRCFSAQSVLQVSFHWKYVGSLGQELQTKKSDNPSQHIVATAGAETKKQTPFCPLRIALVTSGTPRLSSQLVAPSCHVLSLLVQRWSKVWSTG